MTLRYMITNPAKIKFTLYLMLIFWALSASASVHAKRILIYGDSLSAAYGMHLEEGWAHLLAQKLGDQHTVLNASISGDTSAAGLARLPLTLEEFKPDLVMLELGANDGLLGLPVATMRENLEQMIKLSQAAGVEVALVGISVPPSYGPRYVDEFRATYPALAEKYALPFIDFYREDFITTEGYIQEDGLHPTAITQPLVRDIVLAFLVENKLIEPIIEE